MLQPQIVVKPELTVIGCEAAFIHALSPDATNLTVIGELWNLLFSNIDRIPNRIGQEMFGVIYGRPESERAHPDELQYIAGVAVDPGSEVPDGLDLRTVDSGTFAVFTHRGPISTIGKTCGEIYRDWLPGSDYEHAGIADVERYGERFQPDSDDSEMEYSISVRPRATN